MSFVYRGLEAKMERYIVTENDVEHQIEHILEENPKCEHITDRPAQLGDEVILDYAGFCEGEQFQGGTAEKQHLTLGSGMFIPGFEEQLIGKEIGEEVSVFVTFPEGYHSEKLSGKPAEFRCKIHEIHVHSHYELNDEFAKEFGDCENMEEFRQKITEALQAYVDEKQEMELQEKLLVQAMESLDFVPSEEEVEKELNEQMNMLSAQLAQQGINLEMYCQFTGATEEQIKNDIRENAVANIRKEAAIEKIVEIENITADEKEIGEVLEIIAGQNRMTVEQLKSVYPGDINEAAVRTVLTSKVMKLIRETAVIE